MLKGTGDGFSNVWGSSCEAIGNILAPSMSSSGVYNDDQSNR